MATKKVLPDEQRVAEVLERVDKAAEEAQGPVFREIVLTNGAKVRLTPLPALITQILSRQHPEPEVPIAEAEVGGKIQHVPNPDDPRYKRAIEQHRLEMGDAMLKLMLIKSMEILEYPPGVPKYEEDTDGWVEELAFIGITVPEESMARKHTWLQYKILGVLADFSRVQDICNELGGGGPAEADIKAAEAGFPATSTGGASEGVADSGDQPDV